MSAAMSAMYAKINSVVHQLVTLSLPLLLFFFVFFREYCTHEVEKVLNLRVDSVVCRIHRLALNDVSSTSTLKFVRRACKHPLGEPNSEQDQSRR